MSVERTRKADEDGKEEEKEKDTLQPRRSRRGTEVGDGGIEAKREEEGDDSGDDEEEVTRCICAQPEYPGPPAWVRERESGTLGLRLGQQGQGLEGEF